MVERLGVSRTPVRDGAGAGSRRRGCSRRFPRAASPCGHSPSARSSRPIEIRGTLEGLAARLAAERGVGARRDRAAPRAASTPSTRVLAATGRRRGRLALCRAQRAVPRHSRRAGGSQDAGPPDRARDGAALRLAERAGAGAVDTAGGAAHPDRRAGPASLRARRHRATARGPRAEAIMREHARLAHRNLERAFANQRMDLVPGAALIRRRCLREDERPRRARECGRLGIERGDTAEEPIREGDRHAAQNVHAGRGRRACACAAFAGGGQRAGGGQDRADPADDRARSPRPAARSRRP